MDIGLKSFHSSFECESSDEQGDHDEVGKERREPDDVARLVEPLADDQVDDEPAQHEGSGQLPL